jgi:hypothetical protein
MGVRNEPQRFGVRVMLGFLRHSNLRAGSPIELKRGEEIVIAKGQP